MITAPVFQFLAVRFALLAQGSQLRDRVCGEGFHPYLLEGKSYDAAFQWIEQLYSIYFRDLQQYSQRLTRIGYVSTVDNSWLITFTQRFLRTAGIEPDPRIYLLHAGVPYPPLLGLAARQLSAPALALFYELADLVIQHAPGYQVTTLQQLEHMKQRALQLNRPSEVFITGFPILSWYQALKSARHSIQRHQPTDESGYYKSANISSSFPRIDLSEPDARWLTKDRVMARRLLQSGSRS